jgi:fatty-acyl-CoA synthase
MKELQKDWVDYYAHVRPDSVALADVELGTTFTWSELEYRVGRLAEVLQSRGIRSGSRVAVLAVNDPRIFEVQYACMRIGAIQVPLSWRLTRVELRQHLDDAEPTLLIHDGEWADLAKELAHDYRNLPRLEWGDSDSEYEQAIASASNPVAARALDLDAVVQVLYTSGTTGTPKGVVYTNRMITTHAQNLAHSSRMAQEGAHHFNMAPLFHAGGLHAFSNPMLYWGGRVTTNRGFDAAKTLEALTDPVLGITHLCGVLQMYERITALAQFETSEFPTLKTVLFGGWGPEAAKVFSAWHDRGIFIQLAYGASEVGALVSILSLPDLEAAERGTSGTILPHTEVRLVDDNGSDVAPRETGEVWVRGPGVTPGYWRQAPELNFSGEWFRTGDAAWMDDARRIYIVGRLKEMYRSGGENVYPAEVEAALVTMPGVVDLAIVGVPDEKWGETGLLAMVLEPGVTTTIEDVRAFADGKVARFKLPTSLIVLDSLPRSATDKVSRPRIREIWEGTVQR